MWDKYLASEVFGYLLVFCRLGAIIQLVPFFGQIFISPRIRLLFALGISVLMTPIVYPEIPAIPDLMSDLIWLLISEILIGFMIGSIVYFFIAAVVYSGTYIAFFLGLSNAVLFNPAANEQSALTANFLFLLTITFLFVTDLHHIIFIGMLESYKLFPFGFVLEMGDSINALARAAGDSFILGVKLASPFIIFGLIYNLLLGILSRLMPQFQVYFVMLPVQLLGGLALFMITIPSMILIFSEEFQTRIFSFLNL